MSDLIDISFVIIAIAILGFIIKDSFYLYRRANLPYELRDESEKLFSNITIGLWLISFFWLILATNANLVKYLIRPILDHFATLVSLGILHQSALDDAINNLIIYGNLLTIGSFIFILLISVSMVIGIVWMFFDKRYILVTYENGDAPQKFRRIIKESDVFFYFESFKNFRKWKAVPKKNISEIKNILLDETEFGWYGIIATHCTNFFNKHSLVKSCIGDSNRRKWIIVILLVIVFIVITFSHPQENLLISIVFWIALIIMCILVLIHESFSKDYKEDD
ncbi:MAG: hypothetical protein Q8S57_07050 [Methanoregula sp.]|nr:hypothetical protein [Methanoregula sp.]